MNWNCKPCVECKDVYPADDMTTDAFGDSSVVMCQSCLNDLKPNHDRYVRVRVPDICGDTFVFKLELEQLKEHVGEENVKIL